MQSAKTLLAHIFMNAQFNQAQNIKDKMANKSQI